MAVDWVIVKDRDGKTPIGAVGFLGDEIAVLTAFFEDKDWNHDGKVDLKEKIGSVFTLKGKALAEVASRANEDPDIAMRDWTIRQWQGKLLTAFATGMIMEGMYKTYMAYGINQAAGAIAGTITANTLKAALIKKGMESAVKASFEKTIGVR